MTKAQKFAYRFRRIILIAGIIYTLLASIWVILPCFGAIAGFLGTPFFYLPIDVDEFGGYGIVTILFLGLLFLSQWWFLRPRYGRSLQLAAVSRPLKSAIITVAFMAMLLTTGLIAGVFEIFDSWEQLIESKVALISIWISMLLLWGIWAWIFYVYWRQGERYTQLGKMIRGLVCGSLLEMFIAIPVHIWATRQQKCYCARGTYTTLVFSGIVLLWAFGPGIILLYKREKYRRERLFPICDSCGYDLRASKDRCPECGEPINEIMNSNYDKSL